MSFYKSASEIASKYISKKVLFKYGFNYSPMYRRTTAKIVDVTEDLMYVKIKLPISYKNRNYANTIFGGSMFAAVDPISMVQLVNILDNKYIVWDKSAEIQFKRPGKEDLFAEFTFTSEEVEDIKSRVAKEGEIEIPKEILLTTKDKEEVIARVQKMIYVADKAFFKEKSRRRREEGAATK
ncbi:MAG: DUF4442 domain-containing protein [Bacteroidota bacterium]